MPPAVPARHTPRRPPSRRLLVAVVLTSLVLLGPGTGAGRASAGSPPESWQAPADGAVLAVFDPPARPWLPGHRGVDVAAPAGTPVAAPAPGVVTFAGQVGGKPVVVVSHGELRSTFEPVEARRAVGDHVRAGDVVGTVTADAGAAHCAPASCLHWGVRRGATYLDPLALLGRAEPIVLLPWPGS